jgi:hypothetical protein
MADEGTFTLLDEFTRGRFKEPARDAGATHYGVLTEWIGEDDEHWQLIEIS